MGAYIVIAGIPAYVGILTWFAARDKKTTRRWHY